MAENGADVDDQRAAPRPAAATPGAVISTSAKKFTSMTCRNRAGLASSKRPSAPTPALFTSTSSPPKTSVTPARPFLAARIGHVARDNFDLGSASG